MNRKNAERGRRMLILTNEVLSLLFGLGAKHWEVTEGLPEDVRVIDSYIDGVGNLRLALDSAEWDGPAYDESIAEVTPVMATLYDPTQSPHPRLVPFDLEIARELASEL